MPFLVVVFSSIKNRFPALRGCISIRGSVLDGTPCSFAVEYTHWKGVLSLLFVQTYWEFSQLAVGKATTMHETMDSRDKLSLRLVFKILSPFMELKRSICLAASNMRRIDWLEIHLKIVIFQVFQVLQSISNGYSPEKRLAAKFESVEYPLEIGYTASSVLFLFSIC